MKASKLISKLQKYPDAKVYLIGESQYFNPIYLVRSLIVRRLENPRFYQDPKAVTEVEKGAIKNTDELAVLIG